MEIRAIDINYKQLKNINMIFKNNKITTIIGKSGSGKSTLLDIISGIDIVDGIYFDGKKLDKKINLKEYHQKIGYLKESSEKCIFNLTVKKELEFPLKYFKINNYDNDKLIETLKMVGLDESFLDKNPFELSSGEIRKVSLASILIYDPDVIILDEPTANLDNNSVKNLIKIIRNLKNIYKKTIIISSKNSDFLLEISDYIYLLKDGEIYLSGNKYEIFSNSKVLNKCGIAVPKLIEFSNIVKKNKDINIGYRDQINDLIKDIYRYVR
jgi:energy-coupling factor transport system ATP-binding protein